MNRARSSSETPIRRSASSSAARCGWIAAATPSSSSRATAALDSLLPEQLLELVAQARGGKLADQVHLDAGAGEAGRVPVHAEAVAVLVADRAEEPGRVVDEGQRVQDAHDSGLEVRPAAEEVDEVAERVALQRDGHRVDREVAAEEVLAQRGALDPGQRGRTVVELGAGRGHVDARPVAGDHDRGAELLVRDGPAAERRRERAAERDAVPLDGDVEIEGRLVQEDVADGAADEVDALERAGRGLRGLEHLDQAGSSPELLGEVLGDGRCLRERLLERARARRCA